MTYETQNCPDFSTAMPRTGARSNYEVGFCEGVRRGLSDKDAGRFAQGYTHAKQGRTDLLGDCQRYDAGAAFAA